MHSATRLIYLRCTNSMRCVEWHLNISVNHFIAISLLECCHVLAAYIYNEKVCSAAEARGYEHQ